MYMHPIVTMVMEITPHSSLCSTTTGSAYMIVITKLICLMRKPQGFLFMVPSTKPVKQSSQ